MNKDFVPYEQSRKLSELGFNELCIKQYSHDGWLTFTVNDWGQPRPETGHEIRLASAGLQIAAPTFAQAFRWFREKYNLHSEILLDQTTQPKYCFEIHKYENFGNYEEIRIGEWFLYRTFEEAELACLVKLIEIVENEKV